MNEETDLLDEIYSNSGGKITATGFVNTAVAAVATEPKIVIKEVEASPFISDSIFVPQQVQHYSAFSLNALGLHSEYTGAGVRVAIIDEGFQLNHFDLDARFNTSLDYDVVQDDNDASATLSSEAHGTAVAGVIAAEDNGVDGIGISPEAELVAIRRGFSSNSGGFQNELETFQYALNTGVDVINNSYGFTSPFADSFTFDYTGTDFTDVAGIIENLVNTGRSGLGTSIVFSAGNARTMRDGSNNIIYNENGDIARDNTGYHNFQSSPYTIAVGSIEGDGDVSTFSTPGASVLVTATGTGILTTDHQDGVSTGYNATESYTFVNGTSFSAPAVSGVIALMYEANSNLGYRDVQEILAISSRQFGLRGDSVSYALQDNGADFYNGGGLRFSHDFGYGAVDATAAVRLAETWEGQKTFANLQTVTSNTVTNVSIPTTGTIDISLNVTQDIEVEHVLLNLQMTHNRMADLEVTLISPDGTQSQLMTQAPTSGNAIYGGTQDALVFQLNSVANWGESSQGTYTLRIQDTVSGVGGTVLSADLEILGHAQSVNDVYFYTNEYSDFVDTLGASRSTLTDTGGADTINIAAVTSDTTLNMTAGTNSTVDGRTLTIDASTTIENAFTGTGNDTITGNTAQNTIDAGRGNDRIISSQGNDTIDGGLGSDILQFLSSSFDFLITRISSLIYTIQDTIGSFGTDNITGIETVEFTNESFTLDSLGLSIGDSFQASNPDQGLTLNGTSGSETLLGSELNDEMSGLADDDTLRAHNGDDTVHGDGGRDKLYGGDGDDTLNGGDDNDMLYGEAGNDILNGGNDQDRLFGGDGDDTLNGGFGINHMDGGRDIDTAVYAAQSSDFLITRVGDEYRVENTAFSGTSNDEYRIDMLTNIELIQFDDVLIDLRVLALADGASYGDTTTINGTGGNDALAGHYNTDDTIFGFNGDDRLYGLEGNDTLRGGDGNDLLYGSIGSDNLYGDLGSDKLYGGIDSDTLYGGGGTDRLYGDEGDDMLYGDAQNDRLYGGAGNDTLDGGGNRDRLRGDEGADTFIINDISDIDQIDDFNTSDGDIIDISAVLSYDPLGDDIADFVRFTDRGTTTYLEIDSDGLTNGVNFEVAALLINSGGFDPAALDVNQLEIDGNLQGSIV